MSAVLTHHPALRCCCFSIVPLATEQCRTLCSQARRILQSAVLEYLRPHATRGPSPPCAKCRTAQMYIAERKRVAGIASFCRQAPGRSACYDALFNNASQCREVITINALNSQSFASQPANTANMHEITAEKVDKTKQNK